MNGKKGLSRIMSALLAAMSFVGQASADTKKETKKPDRAAAVLRDKKNRGRGKGGNERGNKRGNKGGNERGNKRGNKGGNERGNKRGKKLGLSSAESGVVGWIKGHPKTSAGLGLAGLGVIGYGGYKIYNSERNTYYRGVFSKKTFADYYNSESFFFTNDNVSIAATSRGGLGTFVALCHVDNTEHRLLLSAVAMSRFMLNCCGKLAGCLSKGFPAPKSEGFPASEGIWKFDSFDEIEKWFSGRFSEASQKIKIGKIVRFYRDFTDKYKEKFVDELVKYGEEIKKKLKVEGNKVVCVSTDSLD